MEQNSETTNNSSMSPALLGIVIIVVIAIGGFLLLRKPASQNNAVTVTKEEAITETPSKAMPSTAETTGAAKADDTMMQVEMEAGSFYYKPNIIKAKKGSKIKISFKSVDMMHNFNIDELGVKSPTVKSGNTETFEFTASKAGTFEYYCAIGKHRQNGQVGKLIVE